MKMKYIDNGFWRISAADGKRLAGRLPRPGMETLVAYNGKHYWLARTTVSGNRVWSIRETAWRLVDGRAVLGGN